MGDDLARQREQLVVVGSSAGGIDALTRLVADLPADLPAAIVLAQHLDPNRRSHLADILKTRTSLLVETVQDRSVLSAGSIYVIPPDRHVRVTDGHIDVMPDGDDRPTPSINALLISAAEAYDERLVAVILTGSGSDGAAGALVVKDRGGTVIIEDPETAAFPSMPQSVPASIVDLRAPIDRMGARLVEILTFPDRVGTDQLASLSTVLEALQRHHGVDFSSYKTPTLVRRLNRRIVAVGAADLEAYLTFMRANPAEERKLISSFLIKVTRFFRDPEMYDALRQEVLPGLIAQATSDQRGLRMWSAGCATGEEAYSLAILLAETIGEDVQDVRIFATDLDEAAIAFARHGVYPETAVANMPAELVRRYFLYRDGMYEVRKAIRSMVVFGHHALGQRPPFPNLDLVLCRNVLIYFDRDLQRRSVEAFAYALRPGGFLVLGTSEMPQEVDSLFVVRNRRHRIYRREESALRIRPSWPAVSTFAGNAEAVRDPRRTTSDTPLSIRAWERDSDGPDTARYENVLRQLGIGMVLIDRRYDIEFINASARQLLGIHGVANGQDFIHLAQRIPSSPLRVAIDTALRGQTTTRLDRVEATDLATGSLVQLSLTCQPLQAQADGTVENVVIMVEDVTSVARIEKELRASMGRNVTEIGSLGDTLERMVSANRDLLSANRELTNSVDDLQDDIDSLRLVNTTGQIATEEIETLNEELQATNEELETLNEETQATVEELNATNEELSNRSAELEHLADVQDEERSRLSAILGSLGEAVVVIDTAGTVIRRNEAYDALLGSLGGAFTPTDLNGVVLADGTTPQQRVSRGERFKTEFLINDEEGASRWFEASGSPLQGDSMTGGVLVLRETTDQRLRRLEEQFLHIAGHELRSPLTALQGYLQLARRRVDVLKDDRLARHIGAAIQQVQRQSQLINQLMEVGRLRTGKLALEIEPVDLVGFADAVVETMRVIAPNRTFVVTSDVEALVIEGDALRLEQIVLNLLSNAVKHAPDSERIDLRLRLVAGEAVIEVQDYGPGIPAENRQGIFDLLSQVERTDHSDQSGLGLGLYIAREIAQAHGGSITVLSDVGGGATFVVRLPIAGPGRPTRP